MPSRIDKAAWRKIRRETSHESREPGRAWRLPAVQWWENITRDFHDELHREGLATGVLPLPPDVAFQKRVLRALVNLVREAEPRLTVEDRNLLFDWLQPVTGQHGMTEIMSGGMLHRDKLALILSWNEHDRLLDFVVEKVPRRRRPGLRDIAAIKPHVRAWLDVQMAQALYESSIVCGVSFMSALLRAAQGVPVHLWHKHPESRPGRGIGPPYMADAIKDARHFLGGMTPNRTITAYDKRTLGEFLDMLEAARILTGRRVRAGGAGGVKGGASSNITYVRDSLAHAKYVFDVNGLYLDPYEHKAMNQFAPRRGPKRLRDVHPYAYRVIDPKNARDMLAVACSLVIAFWASYKEFNAAANARVTRALPPPDPKLMQEAMARLARVKMSRPEKARRVAEAKAREKALRDRVKIDP